MKYYVVFAEDAEDAEEFHSYWEWNKGHNIEIAQDAAEQFHRRNGFEADWPVEISILSDDGEELARFEVEMEMVPKFSAKAKERNDKKNKNRTCETGKSE